MFVRNSLLASLAVFGLFALLLLLVSTVLAPLSHAQIAVQSSASAGAAVHSAPGPVVPMTGPVRPPTGAVPIVTGPNPPHVGSGSAHHHHHPDQYGSGYPAAIYAFPVPYAVDNPATDSNADSDNGDDDPNYQGGPTVFDRHGSGADSYIPPVTDLSPPQSAQSADANSADPEPPQAPTVLVFKDGHIIEVGNYAIVGATLFDLTPGHPRRVPLADLDLDATSRQNDDRGVTFQVPSSQQAN